jgi:polyhydroxybutyrate depolymerase
MRRSGDRGAPSVAGRRVVIAGILAMAIVSPALTTAVGATPTVAAPRFLPPASSSYRISITFDHRVRSYRVHIPPAAAAHRRLPLVLNLHGATQNAQLQEIQSGMDATADRDRFVVVYPNGTRVSKVLSPDPIAKQAQYSWNAGACCGLPVSRHVDDVGFLEQVISDVAARTPINLRRVYVTGMSAGGMMAYTMAAKAWRHVAAVASVAGQVQLTSVHPDRPVPTMEFHSVDDPVARWDGVANKDPRRRFSVPEGIARWVKADGCDPHPHTGVTLAGTAGLSATLVTYSPCRDHVRVELWRLTGSGHVWPGAPFNTGPPDTWILAGVGRGTLLVNANDKMWAFFRQYSIPAR